MVAAPVDEATKDLRPGRMKAVTQRAFGAPDDVLELREVEVPGIGDDDVLVRSTPPRQRR